MVTFMTLKNNIIFSATEKINHFLRLIYSEINLGIVYALCNLGLHILRTIPVSFTFKIKVDMISSSHFTVGLLKPVAIILRVLTINYKTVHKL